MKNVEKIPLITKRSTATNISLKQENNFEDTKCLRRKKKLLVTHAVKSVPLSKATMNYPAVNIQTKTPTTLNHLLTQLNPQNTTTTSVKINEEDTMINQNWEENYQDLSDWCMDTFIQVPCDLPAGELNQNKIKGELNDIENIDVKQEVKDETNKNTNYSMNNIGVEVLGDDLNKELKLINNTQIIDDNNNNYNNNNILNDVKINEWENPSSAVLKKDEWIQQIDDDLNKQNEIYDNWDTLDVFNNNNNDNNNSFDLLSYVCDKNDNFSLDENISLDTTTILSNNNDDMMIKNDNIIYEKNKTKDILIPSTETSTEYLNDINYLSVNKKSRGRPSLEKIQEIKMNKGIKRNYHDYDDGLSDCSSNYKDSREKNNEASKKSRMIKKVKETEMEIKAMMLENNNKKLKLKAEQLEKLVVKMRSIILQTALQRNK